MGVTFHFEKGSSPQEQFILECFITILFLWGVIQIWLLLLHDEK